MNKTIAILTFVFTIFAVTSSSFAQRPSRPLIPEESSIRGNVEMPLNVKDHLPVIEAKINGKGPFRFQLDTGFGGMVQLKESVTTQIALPVIGEGRSGDPSGRNPSIVRLLRADSVDVGTAHFGGVTVSESKRKMPNDVDGVIGLSLFHKLKVRLDYINDRFVLSEGALAQNGSLAYTTENGVPSVEIVVNGTKTKVDIDSGSPAEVTLPLSTSKTLPLKREPVVVGRGRTSDGEFEVYSAELKGDVVVGSLILKEPQLDFISVFPIGNLGFRFLKNLSVTFDPSNKRVLFEKALPSSINSPSGDLTKLTKTVGGNRVVAYFAAFNSGDESKLRTFFTENIAPESLKQRPVEPRLVFHRQVKEDFKTVAIKKVLQITDSEIKLLAQSTNGEWIEYGFEIGLAPPNKIIGLSIEATEAPQGESATAIAAPSTKAEFIGAIEKYLNEKVSADAFSGVVMVANGDQPIFLRAYGKADREKGIANKTDTKFNLGSINKAFTRIAIGQLIQQGKIGFDDKLGKFLPDYPNRAAAEKVTIRHLVTMKSGVSDFFGEKFEATPKTKFRSNADFIPMFADIPLKFEPGTNEQYSNGGYILLGAIIEKVTGKNYYDYVRENIFKVAAMSNTDSFESDRMPANSATGYTNRRGKDRINNIDSRPARGSAAGGGYSTAEDLLKFSIALRDGKLSLINDDGEIGKDTGLGIAGGSDGINALLISNSRSRYTIVVLSNYDPPSAELLGKQINDWFKQVKE